MIRRKTLFALCLVVSVLCLAAGYLLAGQWIGAAVAAVTGPAWLLARKYPESWLPFICLFASVGLAVMGLVIGSPLALMICGSAISLAAWDLLLLETALGRHSSGEQTRRYESKHLQSLALALGSGFCLVFIGRFLSFQLPFVVLALFVVLLIFGLDRIRNQVKNKAYR